MSSGVFKGSVLVKSIRRSIIIRILFLTTLLIAACNPGNRVDQSRPIETASYQDINDDDPVSMERDVQSYEGEAGPKDGSACGELWTPYIHPVQDFFDETSTSSVTPGCNLITICLTSNSGSGSASVRLFEVPTSGSQITKFNTVISAPWNGCYAGSSGCGQCIWFNVQNGSKIRLLVTSNSIEQAWQMNEG